MKVGLRYACLSAAVIAVLYGDSSLQARDLIWDPSGASPTTGSDGSGMWDLSTANWADPSTSSDVVWSNANPDSAIFGAGTTTGTGTPVELGVILNQDVTVQNLTLGSTAGGYYSIYDNGGQSLTLQGNITKSSGSGGSQIWLSNTLNLTSGNHVIAINDTPGDTPELTINNTIAGDGSLTLDNGAGYAQWGTMFLNAANSYTGGTNINKGRLVITSGGALGTGTTTIGAQGALAFGGAGINPPTGLTINGPITITRNTYTGTDYNDYTAAIISANGSGSHTINGAFVVDSTDARIQANTSTITINSSLTQGASVAGTNTGMLTIDGDYAGFVTLAGNNSGFGGTIKLTNGVELNVSSEANLGGPTSRLLLVGGTVHPTGALADSSFMTNFGAHDLSGAPVSTGVDVDAGKTFTVDNMTAVGVGKRGAGTMNFTGTNAFTGSLYYDSGTVNFSGNTTMAAIHLRSPIVNITGSLTTNGGYISLGQDSFTTNGGPDKAVVNISGNGSFTQTTGDDFNVSDNANTEGTINISDNGALVTGGITALGKSSGAKGTINQNGGTVTINRGGNFALVLGDRNGTGYYNLNAGTLTSAGEMYVGEGGSGVGYYTQTGGSATVKNWFVIGRESAKGTFDQSGGTFTHSNGGNISIGEGNNTKLNSMTLRGNSVFNDQVGEFWVGNIGGNGTLNIQDTASLTVNDWLAVGRASGASIGVLNLSGGTLTKQGNNYLAIGSGGTGTLNQTGGTLTSTGTRLGEASNGTANLSGGSATFTGEFSLGYANNVVGTLNISNNANVTVPDVVFGVTGTGTGGGAINLNGGTLTGSSFTAGATSTGSRTITFNGGTLRPAADSTNFIGAKITGIVSTGGANIDTNAHAITVNGALTHDSTLSGADGGLTVTGGGTLTLAGVNTYNGATAVNSGSLAVTSTGVINTSTLNSATAISNNGVITTNAGGSINSITGTGTLKVAGGTLALSNPTLGTINSQSAINFSGNGVLDIHKNQIQVSGNQYAALAANYVAGQLKSSDAQLNASSRSVGIAYNGSSTTTARYTTYGDTNLDGKFNGTDIVAINGANNFGGPVGSATWATGDTNYDGKFNGIDVAKINGANSFGTGVITNASPSPALAVVSSIAPNGGDTSKIDLQYDAATGNLRVVTNGNPYGTITLSASSSVFKDGVFGTSPEFYSDDNGDGTSLFFGVLTGQQTADVLLPGVLDTNLSTSTLLSAITVAGVTNGPSPANITFSGGVVPEPASLTVLGLGALGLLKRRRR